MNYGKKLKHSKIKNTGMLFEFLLRQVTADVLNKNKKSKAIKIIKNKFNENKELGKELSLYNIILNKKFKTDKEADFFINEAIRERNNLNNAKLRREKYNLIKEIKSNFDLENLLSTKLKNYRIYASIYSLFEHYDKISPEIKTESHFNLIEHVTTNKGDKSKNKNVLPENTDLRLLSYKILLEKFNEKYSSLDLKQKNLLRQYINNISNTNLFNEFIEKEIKHLIRELKKHKKNIEDKITSIKLNEAINSIHKFCKTNNKNVVKDSVVVQLMRYYELLKELKNA